MVMLKTKDLRNESDDELNARLSTLRKEMYNLRSEQLENKSKQTHLIGQKRKEIARILTLLNEKVIFGGVRPVKDIVSPKKTDKKAQKMSVESKEEIKKEKPKKKAAEEKEVKAEPKKAKAKKEVTEPTAEKQEKKPVKRAKKVKDE